MRYDQYVVDSVRARNQEQGREGLVRAGLGASRKQSCFSLGEIISCRRLAGKSARAAGRFAALVSALRNWRITGRDDAPRKVTGELQADGNMRIRGGVASGQINFSGQEIAAQKLVVKQLSAQIGDREEYRLSERSDRDLEREGLRQRAWDGEVAKAVRVHRRGDGESGGSFEI